mgnify:FL=1
MLSSKATLAQEDIRFSRTINKVQRVLISELNKIAAVHLYANGFDGDDLINFTLKFSNPSTIAQKQKLELFRTRFEIAGTSPEGMLSRDFLRKRVLGLTNEEIQTIERQKEAEKLRDLEVEAITLPETEGEAASPGGIEIPGEEAPEEAEAGEEELETADDKRAGNLILGTDEVPNQEEKAGKKKSKPINPSAAVKSTGNKSNTKARRAQGGGVYDARSFDLGVKANKTTPSKERYTNDRVHTRQIVKGTDLNLRFESQVSAQLKQTLKSLEKSISSIRNPSALLVEGDENGET